MYSSRYEDIGLQSEYNPFQEKKQQPEGVQGVRSKPPSCPQQPRPPFLNILLFVG